MRFFDASIRFGNEITNHEIVNHEGFIIIEPVNLAKDVATLIYHMDEAGIGKAIVSHSAMLDFDPIAGNNQLIAEIENCRDRLIPSWVILPEITDREFACDCFFSRMKNEKVHILRAYPHVNRYLLNSIVMGEQLKIISECKIPLYLETRYGYEYIYSLLSEFPEMTIILTNIGCWPSGRFIYPLLNHYPNVYLETGDLTMLRGYEEITSKFGVERLLFGTNFPTNSMGCALSALMNSTLSLRQKESIAENNLTRLLEEVRL